MKFRSVGSPCSQSQSLLRTIRLRRPPEVCHGYGSTRTLGRQPTPGTQCCSSSSHSSACTSSEAPTLPSSTIVPYGVRTTARCS